ncbi:MAG TPA: formyltransferase family protein [Methylomirabilota bacterium]|jgi:methionyl-tRNA formyltransferase|nr:formyltransferase family protein [Methylomirabilota bacterium]
MELQYFSSGPRERVLDAVLAAGHKVLGVFITDPARWPQVARTVELAARHGIAVRIVRRADLAGLGTELGGSTCLSVGFAYLFPESFIAATKLCLNVHGTLLPKYAGARTLNWVIEHGERESGVTVHVIDAGIDTGPIVLQRAFAVSRFDTGRSLYRKTLAFEPAVVVEALALFESGRAVIRVQDLAGVARHADRTPKHSELDPSCSLLELFDKIRAADPERYPAHFYVDGERVCVRLWRPEKPADESDMV